MEENMIDDNTREVRMTLEELEDVMSDANVLDEKEKIHSAHIEPGELVLTVVR